MGDHTVKFHNHNFNHFWLIHLCDRWTDGQAIAYTALSIYDVPQFVSNFILGRNKHRPRLHLNAKLKAELTRSQAVASIADHTACLTANYLVISDCC